MLQAVESELTMVLGESAAALMLENCLRCMVRADTANAGERSEHPGSLSAREISLNKRLLFGKRISDAGCPDLGCIPAEVRRPTERQLFQLGRPEAD
ncbi:hypothetical protein F9K94_06265 [Brucella tritici]|uniref:Uncharacterized protein n=1 Tax=Brucella tritici TaxID=94626 RepID=A0A7V8B378_9HYPH|nr:hypothetical protein [Brucella tritici]KAB2657821.1 hypothetical protein F9K94_06265 [Brucella tritici]